MSDVSGGLTDIPPNFSVCRDGVDLVSHTAFTMWVVPEVGILVLNLVFVSSLVYQCPLSLVELMVFQYVLVKSKFNIWWCSKKVFTPANTMNDSSGVWLSQGGDTGSNRYSEFKHPKLKIVLGWVTSNNNSIANLKDAWSASPSNWMQAEVSLVCINGCEGAGAETSSGLLCQTCLWLLILKDWTRFGALLLRGWTGFQLLILGARLLTFSFVERNMLSTSPFWGSEYSLLLLFLELNIVSNLFI